MWTDSGFKVKFNLNTCADLKLHTFELYLFIWKVKMAQLMVEEPMEDAVESAFTQVPSKDHWFQYSISPDDFDAEKSYPSLPKVN